MDKLNFYELPLGNITLERLDVWNERHIEAMNGMRDYVAREMCYDVQLDIDMSRKGKDENNKFLVKNSDGYFGYMYISNAFEGERVLAYIVQEKLRGKGLGKIMLTSVSDYLLESGLASSIKLYIEKSNHISSRVAICSGFERGPIFGGDMVTYSRSK